MTRRTSAARSSLFGGTGPMSDAPLVEPRWGRGGHGSQPLVAAVGGRRQDGALAVARGLDTGRRVERQVRFHTALDGREDGR
jgi:hypothetical protein